MKGGVNFKMELRHWESDIKFKYVAKVPVGKKNFRYFYTNEAYQAYLKEKAAAKTSTKQTINSGTKTSIANTIKKSSHYYRKCGKQS